MKKLRRHSLKALLIVSRSDNKSLLTNTTSHSKETYLNGEISLEAGVERDARYK
jgi:hypothetical protein